jgi:hypothetical protein
LFFNTELGRVHKIGDFRPSVNEDSAKRIANVLANHVKSGGKPMDFKHSMVISSAPMQKALGEPEAKGGRVKAPSVPPPNATPIGVGVGRSACGVRGSTPKLGKAGLSMANAKDMKRDSLQGAFGAHKPTVEQEAPRAVPKSPDAYDAESFRPASPGAAGAIPPPPGFRLPPAKTGPATHKGMPIAGLSRITGFSKVK